MTDLEHLPGSSQPLPGHRPMRLQQIRVTASHRVPYRLSVADTARLRIAYAEPA
jgi:hypothetical protein